MGPAAALTNLLPLAGAGTKPPIGEAYTGEGMPLIPAKLAARIRQWEFVEIGELLLEFLARQKDDGEANDCRARQGGKMTNILTWVQCFSSMVAVLAPCEPQVVPEMMAYLNLIVRASQDYEGCSIPEAGSFDGKQAVNSTLYAMNFSARTVGTCRCELCFATSHTEQECAQRVGVSDRLQYLESTVLAMVGPGWPRPNQANQGTIPTSVAWGTEKEHGKL